MALSSCKEKAAEIEALPCSVDAEIFNLIKSDGQVIDLGLGGQQVSPMINNYFFASTPEGISVYHLDGDEPELVEGLSGLKSAGYMSYCVMPICRPGRHIELVDKNGATVASLELPEGEVTECSSFFIDGVLCICTDKGLKGLINTKGQVIVEPKFAALSQPYDGKIIAMTDDASGDVMLQHFSIIDTKGNTLDEFPSEVVPVIREITCGKLVVRTPKGFAVADVNNHLSLTELPSTVRRIVDAAEGVIVYRNGQGLYGLLDIDGNELLPPKQRSILIGPDKRVAVYNGIKWRIMGIDGSDPVDLVDVRMMSTAPGRAFLTGFAFIGRSATGCRLYDAQGNVVSTELMRTIDYSRPVMSHVTTDYPIITAPMEMPEMVEESEMTDVSAEETQSQD